MANHGQIHSKYNMYVLYTEYYINTTFVLLEILPLIIRISCILFYGDM